MRLSSSRLTVVVFSVAATIGAALPATSLGSQERIPAGRIYKMHRPTFTATLVVGGREIIYFKISVLEKCTKSGSGFGGITSRTGGIPIQRDGTFRWDPSEEEIGMPYEEVLAGAVRRNAIVGSYRSWYEDEQEPTKKEKEEAREEEVAPEPPFERCGTLEPRGRPVHFIARHVK